LKNNNDKYIIEGKEFDRVTRILSVVNQPYLAVWKEKIGERAANRIIQQASKFGTEIHNICGESAIYRKNSVE